MPVGRGGKRPPHGTPAPPGNPPSKRRPNPPRPASPVVPSSLPPVEPNYSPAQCPVDSTMFDHRLSTSTEDDVNLNRISWANPVMGTKDDGTRIPGDLWSIWSSMASTMKRYMTLKKCGFADATMLPGDANDVQCHVGKVDEALYGLDN